jgi:energy-coupling factor transport system permease protein
MSLPPSLFVAGDSWIHALDPRVKLSFALLSTIALLSLDSLHVSVPLGLVFALFLAFCHVILLAARAPIAQLGWAWRLILPVTIMIPLLWPLFAAADGPTLLQLGPLAVTWTGIWQGVAAALRVDAMAFAFFVWLFTTDQTEMVLGFVGLGMPYEWGLTLAIALRYVPTLHTAMERVLDAQRARGLVISHTNPVQAARAYIPALVPMLIGALRTAEHLSRALEARAFGAPGRRRTSRRRLKFSLLDGVALAVMVAVWGAILALRAVTGAS